MNTEHDWGKAENSPSHELRREREEEVIQAKDGWAVADKIDQFFNEVLILVVLIVSTSF